MIFFEMFVSFTASLAFAVIFDVSGGELIFCGISGLISQGIYSVILNISSEPAFAILAATAAVSALARIFANVRKMPVTLYLISGIIPLVPGSGMYNTVFNIISSDYARAASVGVETIKAAAAIAVGIVLIFALPNKLFLKRKNKA